MGQFGGIVKSVSLMSEDSKDKIFSILRDIFLYIAYIIFVIISLAI